jgi:hypothetical protein
MGGWLEQAARPARRLIIFTTCLTDPGERPRYVVRMSAT